MPDNTEMLVRALQGQPPPSAVGVEDVVKGLRNGSGSPMRTIQVIRHGATKLNNDDVSVDRIRGWKDIPLSEDGREEAKRLGEKIAKGKDKPDGIVSSDLKRAQETAKIISDISGTPILDVTQHFRPWNVGDYSGQVTSKAIPVLAEYAKEKPDQPIPGGEAFNDFRNRFMDGLHSTLAQYPGKIAIVTHHRGERLLNAWRKAGFPESGDIDVNEFNKKGEHTGAVNDMQVPMRNGKANGNNQKR